MKSILVIFLLLVQTNYSHPPVWSKTGHRVTGEIAQRHLTRKARKAVNKLLKGQSLAEVSNYADDIKSDPEYREFGPWHYVNYPDDRDYTDFEPNPSGDIVMGIQHCISVLEDETSSESDRVFYLKMLVHFLGDLHQPLHVGRAADKGGNDIQIRWFDTGSNLHRLWDSNMIDHYRMSYTELANKLPDPSKKEIKALQAGDVYQWVEETQELATMVYNSAEVGEELGYVYIYKHWPTVEQQLLRGGLRLAAVLNKIYS